MWQYPPELCSGFLFFRLIYSLNLRKLGFICVINPRPVLDTGVIALPVYGQRVNDHKIKPKQLFQRDPVRIIINPYLSGPFA